MTTANDPPNVIMRAWRDYRGLTQDQLAKAAGYNRSFVYRVEAGAKRYSKKYLEAIAAVLQCSTGDLISHMPPSKTADEIWAELSLEERDTWAEFITRLRRPAEK